MLHYFQSQQGDSVTRISLHRWEYERGWTRVLMMSIIVLMFGLFSCLLIWQVAAETHSGTFSPIAQNRAVDWDPEQWSREIPVAIALVVVPVITALAIGVHSLSFGGILGFGVHLFNLLPFYVSGQTLDGAVFRGSPVIWGAFLVAALLAFYAGDLGSWICRRRLRQETAEDEVFALQEGEPREALER